MAQTWRFYLVADDSTVTGTDDFEVAAVAKRDGSTLVIEPGAAEATFDCDVQPIEEADPDEYLGDDPPSDEDEDGDNE